MRQPDLSTDSSSFAVRRSLMRRLTYDASLPTEVVGALWQNPDRLLYSSAPLQVKDRCAVAVHESADGALLVKRHTWGGLWRTIRSAWREASARRCGRIGLHLAEHGIPTPRSRAWLEQRFGPWGYRSYIVTAYVEGTSLYRYIRFGNPAAEELRHLAQQVAAIWQRLVELGVSHNDMKPENFIVDDELKVWLIDFEKVRVGGKARRQRERHVGDVKNFLDVRSWHHRSQARQVFLDAFLRVAAGEWLCGLTLADLPQRDVDLSVSILCSDHTDLASARRAIDSVRDIADEIVLIGQTDAEDPDVTARIEPCGDVTEAPEWVLVLHEGEALTPFLAKELQQRITDPNAADAFRMPIERQYFGRSFGSGADHAPVRLFRRDRCAVSLAGGELAVSAEGVPVGQLTGVIEQCACASVADAIERLNAQTTAAASERFHNGERARLLRAGVRAAATFFKAYLRRTLWRSGWAGVQVALLDAAFCWIEEAKLRQMASEFHCSQSESIASDIDEARVSSRAAA
jgi:tRNA A-37 threonylcarbamoyl transferase component Bud32